MRAGCLKAALWRVVATLPCRLWPFASALEAAYAALAAFYQARRDVQRLACTLSDPAWVDDVIDPRD